MNVLLIIVSDTRVATLLEILGPPGNSRNLLDLERKSLILLEVSWNILISMFQRFVLKSFIGDAM